MVVNNILDHDALQVNAIKHLINDYEWMDR